MVGSVDMGAVLMPIPLAFVFPRLCGQWKQLLCIGRSTPSVYVNNFKWWECVEGLYSFAACQIISSVTVMSFFSIYACASFDGVEAKPKSMQIAEDGVAIRKDPWWADVRGRGKELDGFISSTKLGVFPSDAHLYRAARSLGRPLTQPSTHLTTYGPHYSLTSWPSIDLLTYLLIRLLALLLLSSFFWLCSATDHRSHTPTITSFQSPKASSTLLRVYLSTSS